MLFRENAFLSLKIGTNAKMTSPAQKPYNDFLKIFKEANSGLTKENQYKKAQQLWNEVKSNSEYLANTTRQLKTTAATQKSTIEGFWTKTVTSQTAKELTFQKIILLRFSLCTLCLHPLIYFASFLFE